jgi:cytochrome c553
MDDRTSQGRMTVFRYLIMTASIACSASAGVALAAPPALKELVGKAMSAAPDAQHGRILYLKHCTGCHGQSAWGNGPKEIPALAGQRESYLVEQLAQFATLERNGSAMHKATSAADVNHPQAIRDLAAYLAKAPGNPKPEQGSGAAAATGEKLFQRGCAMCHGTSAQGSADEPIPALAGQHYSYTLVQLKNFAAGHRGQVEPPVIDFTAGLSSEDQSGIADYLSKLKPTGSPSGP